MGDAVGKIPQPLVVTEVAIRFGVPNDRHHHVETLVLIFSPLASFNQHF